MMTMATEFRPSIETQLSNQRQMVKMISKRQQKKIERMGSDLISKAGTGLAISCERTY